MQAVIRNKKTLSFERFGWEPSIPRVKLWCWRFSEMDWRFSRLWAVWVFWKSDKWSEASERKRSGRKFLVNTASLSIFRLWRRLVFSRLARRQDSLTFDDCFSGQLSDGFILNFRTNRYLWITVWISGDRASARNYILLVSSVIGALV